MRVYRVYMNSQYGFRSTLLPGRTLHVTTATATASASNEKIINDFVNNLSHFIEVFIPWPPTVNTQLIWWVFDCFSLPLYAFVYVHSRQPETKAEWRNKNIDMKKFYLH